MQKRSTNFDMQAGSYARQMNETDTEASVDKLNKEMFTNVLPVTIFVGLLAFVGFFGNSVILFVYSKFYSHCNFRYFVLCLAIYDLTSSLTTLPGEVYSHFNWYNYKYDWICKVKSYFNVFTAWGSAYTLLLLAFDRYRKICRPLCRQIQPSLALKLCCGGIILSSMVSVPILFLWGKQIYTYKAENKNLNVSTCEKSGEHANDNYPFIYISCVYIIPVGLMMGAISVFNVLLTRTLSFGMLKCRENTTTETNTAHSDNTSIITSELHKASSFTTSTTVDEGVGEYEENQIIDSTHPANGTIKPARTKEQPTTNESDPQEIQSKTRCSLRNATNVLSVDKLKNYRKTGTRNNSEKGVVVVRKTTSVSDGNICIPRRKRKTLIMLTLTSVYIVTMTVYICLVSLVAEKDGILKKLSKSEHVVFFFFLRLYFINSVINPILYGLMDPRFRAGLKRLFLPSCLFAK